VTNVEKAFNLFLLAVDGVAARGHLRARDTLSRATCFSHSSTILDQGMCSWGKCCNSYSSHIFHFLGFYEMAVVSQLKTQSWLITWELKPVVEPKLKFGSRSTTFTCQDVTYKMNFTKHLEHLQLDLQLIKGN
jgi:hypothetical protein